MARILVSQKSPIPDKLTGIGVYTWAILEALARSGKHAYVLAADCSPKLIPPILTELGVEIVHLNNYRNESLALLQNSWRTPGMLKKYNCQLVFHPQPNATLFACKRSVTVLHDLYRVTHPELHNWKQLLQWRWLLAPAFCASRELIAVSDATRQTAINAYPRIGNRITTVHEASPIEPPDKLPPPPPEEKPYALMVANITPNKNVKLLIDALKIQLKRGNRPRVRLIGRDEFGVLPELIDGENIDFKLVGGVSSEMLSRYYAHAHCYVNTSKIEGFCLPILEAQTFGVPVICSDLPVLREVAGEGALFIDPDDPASLAAAIERLFGEVALTHGLVAKARKNVARFSWAKAARETEAVFERVLEANK